MYEIPLPPPKCPEKNYNLAAYKKSRKHKDEKEHAVVGRPPMTDIVATVKLSHEGYQVLKRELKPMSDSALERMEKIDEILDGLMCGHSLSNILASEEMPTRSTFMEWLARDEILAGRYERAREIGGDVLFEKIMDIASKDYVPTRFGTIDSGEVQSRRLHVESILKTLSKLFPRKYGERMMIEDTRAAAPITLTFADVQKIKQQQKKEE